MMEALREAVRQVASVMVTRGTPQRVVLTATGDVAINTTGNVVLTPGGTVQLGGTGGRKVVLDGDPVTGGTVRATSSKVLGQ